MAAGTVRNFGIAQREREWRLGQLLDDPYDSTAVEALADPAGNAFWGGLREQGDRANAAGLGYRVGFEGMAQGRGGLPLSAAFAGHGEPSSLDLQTAKAIGLNEYLSRTENAGQRDLRVRGTAAGVQQHEAVARQMQKDLEDRIALDSGQVPGHLQAAAAAQAAKNAPAPGSFGHVLESLARSTGRHVLQLTPQEILVARQRFETAGRAPKEESKIWVMRDGKPLRVSESEYQPGDLPASTREQGRPVTAGDAADLADFNTSLDELMDVKGVIKDPGTITKIQSFMPTFVSEMTGGWTDDAKEQNAVISRVRQVIGKALEGGVLRKEDEVKYKDILPVLGDSKSVATSKIDGLNRALQKRITTRVDALEDAGYDVSRFRTRSPHGETGGGGDMVAMVAPDGRSLRVPAAKVAELEALGAKRGGG